MQNNVNHVSNSVNDNVNDNVNNNVNNNVRKRVRLADRGRFYTRFHGSFHVSFHAPFHAVIHALSPALLRVATVALLAACSNDVTAPSPVEGMSFSYSGAVSGTFAASGAPDTTVTGPWAVAQRISGTPLLIVVAVRPRNATSHDAISIVIPRVTPGTSPIENICQPEGCPHFIATFGRQNGGSDFLQGCYITSGTVTVTKISDTRVSGSFKGNGSCFNNADGETAFEVTAGSFELPLMVGVP